jgi:hypothetical protein
MNCLTSYCCFGFRVVTVVNTDITLTMMSRMLAGDKHYPYNDALHACRGQTLPLQRRPARLQETNITLTMMPCTLTAGYCKGNVCFATGYLRSRTVSRRYFDLKINKINDINISQTNKNVIFYGDK